MRKALAVVLLGIALAALVGLMAVAFGADLGKGASPMLFARAMVISVGLFFVTIKVKRRR